MTLLDGSDERAALRPADRRARLGVARAADPRARRARRRLQDAARRGRAAQPRVLQLETAEEIDDPEQRRQYLTFVYVGAGYAGLEGIAELQDYVADVIDRYPRCRLDGTRWILVEAQDRVMPEIPASLAEFATRELRGRGIEIRTGTMLEAVGDGGRACRPARRSPRARSAGPPASSRPPVVRELGLPLTEHGRIDVDATLRVRRPARASGRSATPPRCPIPRARAAAEPADGPARAAPGTVVADNVAATLAGRPLRRSATARSACSSTWASTRRSRRCSACGCAASRPGSPPAPTTCC